MERLELSKKLLGTIAIIIALSSANSRAEMIILDFEGIGDLTPVNNFYNGGSGINHGVYFSNDAEGIIDLDENINFSGNFANEPSGSTALIFRDRGGAATMNIAAGFTTTFSLFYSSKVPAIVRVFDSLDGTGNELAISTLVANYTNNCSGDPNGDWCHWDQIAVNFSGTAKSVVFDGPREYTFYDSITLGSETPDSALGSGIIFDITTPDPGSGNTPIRDLMSECKKDLKWHRRNSRGRRMVNYRHSLAYANLHKECKIFRWYRQNRR